jgi:hypothetical protein
VQGFHGFMDRRHRIASIPLPHSASLYSIAPGAIVQQHGDAGILPANRAPAALSR